MFSKISRWIGRLSVGRKLTLIYFLDLCAVIYISSILIHEKFLSIDFARKEIVGAAYTEVVRSNLIGAFLVPKSTAEAKANALQEFEAVRREFDASLQVGSQSERLAQLLVEAKNPNFLEQSKLIAQGRDVLTTVGNQSNLILDPDLDSYYVMSLTVLRFPELLQVMYDTWKFMQANNRKVAGIDHTAQLLTLVGKLDAALQGMDADFEQAILAGTEQQKTALQPTRKALVDAVRLFQSEVNNAVNSKRNARESTQMDAAYQSSLTALSESWRLGVVQLGVLLQTRVDGLFARMWLHLGTALLLLVSILTLVYLVARQISRPLQALARVADDVRLTADYTLRAEWRSGDEIGQLYTAFNSMLSQLDEDRLLQQDLTSAARAAEAQLELVESFPMPIVVTSVPDHEVLHFNGPAQPWLAGVTRDPWRSGLEATVRSRFFQRLYDFDAVDEFEVRWLGTDAPTWAVLSARRLQFQGRDAVLTTFTPINKLKVMEQRLELWAKVFEASSESIIIMDKAHDVISVNRAFCRSTGYEFHEVVGRNLNFLVEMDPSAQANDWQKNDAWQGEVHISKHSGGRYPAWLMISAVQKGSVNGEVDNYIGISVDITDRKAKEDRIRFLAQHDVLTELPNRALCQQRLAEALGQARVSGEKVAVLFIDLDRFKLINDTLGHHIGDGLLRTVARRLTQAVRAQDTVSRLGGDEFVIIMRNIADRAELETAVNGRLIPSIRQNALVEGHSLAVSCSVGVALFPDDASEQDELMRQADAAMYEAKAAGRDMARYFSPETDQKVQARQTMEAQLRQALANQEFNLHYQPRLNARTRRIQGAEALLRWNNPLLGSVGPAQFIPLTEETGLIKPIGAWVLQEACTQWMQFQDQGLFDGLELSVNLSAVQLADPDLLDQLQAVLQRTGMPAHQLELELTESHLMDNPAAAQETLSELKALGIKIAIDDFGTGYSSLAYIKRFELNKLKIDQSFVRSMLADRADAAIVHAVVALGHTLGLTVVAEGVEDNTTAQALTALGCDELQGYYFSRPLAASDFEAWVRTQTEKPDRRRRNVTKA